VVASYFAVSIALVFVNKVLLSKDTSIPAPLFVTWFQCVVTAAILWGLGEAGKSAAPGSFFAQFPPAAYELPTARKLAGLAVIFVGMITFNNLSLQYVEVSFYNVARSLTIVFNVVLTFFLLGESTSVPVLGTLAMVVAGFFLGSAGEMRFSLLGCAFGVTSSLFVALNGIWTKKGMAIVEGNQWRLSFYNNVTASVLFLPLILATGEWRIISAHAVLLHSAKFWIIMTLGGVFGFLIGIVTILQIKVTSPLTHNISGTAKACVQTVLALWIWQNPTSAANLAGTGLVLLGSGAYTYVRSQEMASSAASKAGSSSSSSSGSSSGGSSGSSSAAAAGSSAAEASDSAVAPLLSAEGSGSSTPASAEEELLLSQQATSAAQKRTSK
jgi:GDP-fucose transporter C1